MIPGEKIKSAGELDFSTIPRYICWSGTAFPICTV